MYAERVTYVSDITSLIHSHIRIHSPFAIGFIVLYLLRVVYIMCQNIQVYDTINFLLSLSLTTLHALQLLWSVWPIVYYNENRTQNTPSGFKIKVDG